MKISIIVPVYNIEEYISRCLESIVAQTYEDLEIIVIDDGSYDRSGEICDMFAKVDDRVFVIHKQNGGLVSARKAGSHYVTGEYVLNIDGDDWIEKDYVENFAKRITDKHEDMICAIDFYKDYCDSSMIYCAQRYADIEIQDECIQNEMRDLVKGRKGFSYDIEYSLWLKCIKSDLYKEIQDTVDDRISYNEDVACVVRCLGITNKVGFIHNCGYHYCQRDSSITRNPSRKSLESIRLVYESTLKFIEKSEDKEGLQKILEGVYIRAMVNNDFAGMQNGKEYLAPFESVVFGSRIIVYGMGVMGRQIISYLVNNKNFQLIAWTDSNYDIQKQLQGRIKIIRPDEICNYECDFVIIASSKNVFIEQIKNVLHSLDVSQDRIVCL